MLSVLDRSAPVFRTSRPQHGGLGRESRTTLEGGETGVLGEGGTEDVKATWGSGEGVQGDCYSKGKQERRAEAVTGFAGSAAHKIPFFDM